MKIQLELFTIVCSTAVLLAASGNVLSMETTDFKINTVASNKATLSNVRLSKTAKGYVINGNVQNKSKHRKTAIPGHIDISVVGTDGKIINTSSVSFSRHTRISRFAKFTLVLKVPPPAGSSIRVSHHNSPLGDNATDRVHK